MPPALTRHVRLLGRRSHRAGRLTAGLVAAAAVAAGALTTPGQAGAVAPQAAPPETGSPFVLWAPERQVVAGYDGRVYSDLGLRLVAQGEPFELWSHRPSYDEAIRTVWRSEAHGDVELPTGSMRDFGGIRKFLRLTITPVGGGEARTTTHPVCLGGSTERVDPAAVARSAYPRTCGYNPFALGSVQGVEEGWATSLFAEWGRPFRLAKGRYDVTATIPRRYAEVFGLSEEEATRTTRLVVKEESFERKGRERPAGEAPQPAAQEPDGAGSVPVEGPKPDLRSLPAFAMSISGNGNYLRFAANVWNAGDSPLVVDGFRRQGEDEMDAYQYFFDTEGNQTAYTPVGHMHWDPKPTHRHWHFKDFARYTMLRADKSEVVRSRKEAFCLAPTDAVDLTVPGADWNVENGDLSTACGDYSSLSIREVLQAGWGDTYAQFRAGQSFDLRGLPNGTYWIAVIANPRNRLVESDTTNNVALRKVRIGGTEGARTVKAPPVGVIKEPDYFGK